MSRARQRIFRGMWPPEALFMQACPDDPRGIQKLHAMPWDEAAQWCVARLMRPS